MKKCNKEDKIKCKENKIMQQEWAWLSKIKRRRENLNKRNSKDLKKSKLHKGW
jgi:hypothetical protein